MLVVRMAREGSARPAGRWWIAALAATGFVAGAQLVGAVPAVAQAMVQAGPGKPPTPDAIGKACRIEKARFCPNGRAGTRADIGCLQQHHTNLGLGCRKMLERARATPAPAVRRGLS